MKYAMKHRTPQQEGWAYRGVGQRVMGVLADGIRGGYRRCCSRGLGWWEGVGSLRRRNGGPRSRGDDLSEPTREPWRSVSASG